MFLLRSGNYEILCLRHRETQTLYISDILHIPFLKDPGYGKLQIATYIIALEDTLHRTRLNKVGYPIEQSNFSHRKDAITAGSTRRKRSGGSLEGRRKKRPRVADNSKVWY